MNVLPYKQRCAVIRCLVDGCSIRATTRSAGVAKNTILKLTRQPLTSAFSKKSEMLIYAVAIMFFYHNVVRIHQTLRMTPSMKTGITNHKWSIEEMVDLLPLNLPGKRGPYKKRISN